MTPVSVLYVDDDPDIRTIVALALSLDPQIALVLADSGEQALAMLAEGSAPDVVLMDMMMPGMDGLTLMQRLRGQAATAGLPVIVMSARTREADVASYRSAGAIGVVMKPFDPLRLAAEVRAILARD